MESKNKLKELNQLEAYYEASHAIEDTYKTESGKKFIHHLIDSFMERDVAFILFSKKKIFDCITKSILKTVYSPDHICNNKDVLDTIDKIKTVESQDEKFNILKKASDLAVANDKTVDVHRTAMRAKTTNKIIGYEEFQALVDFTQDQVNKGDKTIIRMIRYSKLRNSPNFKIDIPKNENKESIKKAKAKAKSASRLERDSKIEDKLQQLVNKYKK